MFIHMFLNLSFGCLLVHRDRTIENNLAIFILTIHPLPASCTITMRLIQMNLQLQCFDFADFFKLN